MLESICFQIPTDTFYKISLPTGEVVVLYLDFVMLYYQF